MNNSIREQDIKLFDKIVETRRSIRVFKDDPPSDSKIKAIFHAGF